MQLQSLLWTAALFAALVVGFLAGIAVDRGTAPSDEVIARRWLQQQERPEPTPAPAPPVERSKDQRDQQQVLGRLTQQGIAASAVVKWGPKEYFRPRATDAEGNFRRWVGPGYHYRLAVIRLKDGTEKEVMALYDAYDDIGSVVEQ